ncbi:MAG: tetratricopeptide repeat protein [Candidatus Acidiferrales bacterium]
MKRPLSVLLISLVLTAAYLFAWPSPNVFYFVIVVVHLVLGIAFVPLILLSISRIFRGSSWTCKIGWGLLFAGAALGIALLFTGTRRSEWPLLYAHIVACVAGAAFLASDWAGNRGWLASGTAPAVARLAIFLLGAAGLTAAASWLRTVPWHDAHRITNPRIAPPSMDAEGDGPGGPFFPSSAQTAHGGNIPANFFMESESCQRCHSEIYREWQSSMHHFSSFNNQWYRKSIEYMQDVAGVKPSKWCGGCHDPALLFSGMMDTPIRQIVNTPEARAGLGCMMCHSIAQVKSSMGQGDFQLEYPALHRMANSRNPVVRRLHDFLTELNPEPHRRVFLKPFMRAQPAEFCSVCHKVHLDVPVNHYRWIRGFNEYDNWQASGVSGQGARSFYYPPRPQNCADCHMPPVRSNEAGNISGFVHSHRFIGANTAVPFENHDDTQLAETEKFLRDQIMSVDIFGISPETAPKETPEVSRAAAPAPAFETTFAVGEEAESAISAAASTEGTAAAAPLSAPLNRVKPAVRRGDVVRVDVVVRTRKLGHFFPGGTVDAYDCWLEFSATDENGKPIFLSGGVADDGRGPVDPGAHFYRSLQIDAHGNPINKRNAWATRAVVYVHLIPPGAADTTRYRLQIPKDAGHRIRLQARLNYRKFAWWNTHFAFAGVRDPNQLSPAVSPDYDDSRWVFTGDTSQVSGDLKAVPTLPIVTLAQDEIDLTTLPPNAPAAVPRVELDASDWQRWNDYGIGLLLQGDLKGAEAAFEKITQIDPKNPEGWVNIGRVRVQEGNTAAAKQVLEHALALSPSLARAHFFYGRASRDEGRLDDAIFHFRQVLVQYPRDRVAHDELGRALFLERRYPDAIREFEATLSIDPEDLEANYNLMLCYTGVNQPERAADFQRRYLRFKADEAAQTLTGPYRRSHPEDNLERQPIHEHTSAPLGTGRAAATRAASGGPAGSP